MRPQRPAWIALSALAGLLVGYALAMLFEQISIALLAQWLQGRPLETLGRWLGSQAALERCVLVLAMFWKAVPVALAGGLLVAPLMARGLHRRAFCYAVLVWPLLRHLVGWQAVAQLDPVDKLGRPGLFAGALRDGFAHNALEQFILYSLFFAVLWLAARRSLRAADAAGEPR